MNSKITKSLKFLAFLALGVLLFWLVYKDQDVDRLKSILKNDVNYWWVLLSLVLGLLSHVSRTIRWNLMIEPLGKTPRTLNTFLAVMVGYLMNLVFPRMGEISRCGVLARYENMSFTQLIGTVVVERIIDVIMLLLLTLTIIVVQFGEVIQFLDNNPEVKAQLSNIAFSPWAVLSIAGLIGLLVLFRKRLLQTKALSKVRVILNNFAEGLRSFKDMRNKWAFLAHSIFIWVMYYLMLYVIFFSFDFTSHLSAIAGLTTFVLGSYGMVAPVQGGIGAWHFMVMQVLMVYGIDKADGMVFALLAHTSMMGMMIILGLVALLILPFINRREATA
ncbi:lysylphosphatidylglycerol synthase transmembrane domain-containing protein [uncultured Sunxiuqinia sp.]|uniref:lysylphosphatidylglycerol synthase transmembrane domain-containing protein n=1 Tax=Sunxiuqinia rutila TaxID=1397841 RepID=UPI002636F788|nr:lysylphosphatidylglycerol synthase transmembrane domain-containing protein [uncultured Sunxiuqinia sp.]